MAVLLPVGAVVGLLLSLLCCCACYYRRWLEQVCALRLCAPRLREKCWAAAQKMKAWASLSSTTSAAAETSVTQSCVANAAGEANTLKPTTANSETADEDEDGCERV